jgi:polysaccharide biosynthesis/export protein
MDDYFLIMNKNCHNFAQKLKNMKLINMYLVCFIMLILFNTSCTSVNQLRYFKNLPDSSVITLPHMDQEARVIQKGDKLQISIGAHNPEAAAVFNNYGDVPTSGGGGIRGGAGGAGASDLMGFWVDENGQIEFPIIGKINVVGLTALQLKDTLTQRVLLYLRDPIVTVKFINFKFTVLGEVNSPGTYVISMQRTTLLDALGAAGDLPRTAKRYDIQLYRDYKGKRTISKIDLRDKALLTNMDLFQVRHNDIIIVQPRDVKFLGEEARTYIGLLTLLLGTAALIISASK